MRQTFPFYCAILKSIFLTSSPTATRRLPSDVLAAMIYTSKTSLSLSWAQTATQPRTYLMLASRAYPTMRTREARNLVNFYGEERVSLSPRALARLHTTWRFHFLRSVFIASSVVFHSSFFFLWSSVWVITGRLSRRDCASGDFLFPRADVLQMNKRRRKREGEWCRRRLMRVFITSSFLFSSEVFVIKSRAFC